MIPVLFINCKEAPYVDDIMAHQKIVETRSSDTLKALVGKRVLIAATGRGKPVVCGSAIIRKPITVTHRGVWETLRPLHGVPEGSSHDWKENTKRKYLYILSRIKECEPFTPPEGKRHGRVWMEYSENA